MFGSLSPAVPLNPYYAIASKQPVDAGAPSLATFQKFDTAPSASFRTFEEDRVLAAFKESIVTAWPGPNSLSSPTAPGGTVTNAETLKSLPPRPFEFPDGWNNVFGVERFKVAEGLFDASAAYSSTEHTAPTAEQTITSVIRRAVDAVDVDARPTLLNNVIITGAGSLIEKLPERIQSDLALKYPNPKVRVIANTSTAERRFGSWIGGSVLGSLGTFHQMWISKQEYDEFGASIVDKRCK
jgi:actin-related protein 4